MKHDLCYLRADNYIQYVAGNTYGLDHVFVGDAFVYSGAGMVLEAITQTHPKKHIIQTMHDVVSGTATLDSFRERLDSALPSDTMSLLLEPDHDSWIKLYNKYEATITGKKT